MNAAAMDTSQSENAPDGVISTWSALQTFGFRPDEGVFPNDGSALSIDLGGFKLSVSKNMQGQDRPTILPADSQP